MKTYSICNDDDIRDKIKQHQITSAILLLVGFQTLISVAILISNYFDLNILYGSAYSLLAFSAIMAQPRSKKTLGSIVLLNTLLLLLNATL